MNQTKGRDLVTQYYAEHFNFGGKLRTRKEIIEELKELGGKPAMIDRYLQGLDLAKQIQARHPGGVTVFGHHFEVRGSG